MPHTQRNAGQHEAKHTHITAAPAHSSLNSLPSHSKAAGYNVVRSNTNLKYSELGTGVTQQALLPPLPTTLRASYLYRKNTSAPSCPRRLARVLVALLPTQCASTLERVFSKKKFVSQTLDSNSPLVIFETPNQLFIRATTARATGWNVFFFNVF